MYCIPYGIQYKIAPWAQFGEFLVEFYLLLRLLAFDKMCLVAFWVAFVVAALGREDLRLVAWLVSFCVLF